MKITQVHSWKTNSTCCLKKNHFSQTKFETQIVKKKPVKLLMESSSEEKLNQFSFKDILSSRSGQTSGCGIIKSHFHDKPSR